MTLNFKSLKKILVDGKPYLLQKADVTHVSKFWSAWRYAAQQERTAIALNVDPPKDLISARVCLSKELVDGQLVYYAYRLISAQEPATARSFPVSYRLKHRDRLLPYQVHPVARLCAAILKHGAACDGSDTGLGKTYMALAVARDLLLRPGIICRKSGIAVWYEVARFFEIEPLFIINWESAKSPGFEYTRVFRSRFNNQCNYKWAVPKNTLLIFDEAHMGNNPQSQNSQLWMSAKAAAPVLSLSATFADRPERLRSLFTVLGAMDNEQFDTWLKSIGHFRNRYDGLESVDDIGDMKQAHAILYPAYGHRLRYESPQVAKYVPKAIIQTEMVYLGRKEQDRQNALYNAMLHKVQFYRKLGQQAKAMTADLRYRQATELLKAPVLVDLVRNYMEQNLAVIVFVNFHDTLFYLSKHLKTNALIYGEQEKHGIPRRGVINAFQADKISLVLSMVSAGGQSISLHDVNGKRRRISLLAPTYNAVDLQQVVGRTYRARSKTRPIIKLVYAANTVEGKVASSVNSKINNIRALNDGDLMEPDLFSLKG